MVPVIGYEYIYMVSIYDYVSNVNFSVVSLKETGIKEGEKGLEVEPVFLCNKSNDKSLTPPWGGCGYKQGEGIMQRQ